MYFSDTHKALLITALLSGTVILAIFSLSLKQKINYTAESYYILEPDNKIDKAKIEKEKVLEKNNSGKAETNEAYDASRKSSRFAQAYQLIEPPEDYIPKRQAIDNSSAIKGYKSKYKNMHLEKTANDELTKFDAVNALLEKQKKKTNNANSTMSFSLTNRSLEYYETPIYLCERGGKIVITILVNGKGIVTEASLNTSSNSSNACLIKHAIQYAKEVKFNSDLSKDEQIGSITFNFLGK